LAVSRTTYATLFAVTGTTYGVGDGSTTFYLPDLRGRVPVGVDGAAARLSANDALGNSSGAETHTLTTSEMPSHTHDSGSLTTASDGAHTHTTYATRNTNNTATGTSNVVVGLTSSGAVTGTTSSDGSHSHNVTSGNTGGAGLGLAHNNMQPYQVTQYIIKT
jgi:microcystin-dependent protein